MYFVWKTTTFLLILTPAVLGGGAIDLRVYQSTHVNLLCLLKKDFIQFTKYVKKREKLQHLLSLPSGSPPQDVSLMYHDNLLCSTLHACSQTEGFIPHQ